MKTENKLPCGIRTYDLSGQEHAYCTKMSSWWDFSYYRMIWNLECILHQHHTAIQRRHS